MSYLVLHCPECGRSIESDWRLCPYCETDLLEVDVVSPDDPSEPIVDSAIRDWIIVLLTLAAFAAFVLAIYSLFSPWGLSTAGMTLASDPERWLNLVGFLTGLAASVGLLFFNANKTGSRRAVRIVGGMVGHIPAPRCCCDDQSSREHSGLERSSRLRAQSS